jgi:hypothetical protein
MITPAEVAEKAAEELCRRFDETAVLLYDKIDAEQGFIEVEDRQGVAARFPIVTVSVGVASTSRRKFAHYGEAVEVATEMKQVAKRDPKSSYAVDRRSN